MRYDAAAFLEGLFQPLPEPEIRVEALDPDWRVEWEERAAIMEFDGGLPRERAEALALVEIIKAMKPVSQQPGRQPTPAAACRVG